MSVPIVTRLIMIYFKYAQVVGEILSITSALGGNSIADTIYNSKHTEIM
jgi:flagellar biosynthesis protein FliR